MTAYGAAPTARRQCEDGLVQTDGHWRVVERKVTTCGSLFRRGQIKPGLMTHFDELVASAAHALGVAVNDGAPSTSKFIFAVRRNTVARGRAVSEMIGGQPSWRTPSDRQLRGQAEVKFVADYMPPELLDVFWLCLSEELGAQTGRSPTLAQLGERRGYQSTRNNNRPRVEPKFTT